MGIVITPESPLGIEMAKWNKPYVFQPFPKMVYKARRPATGGKVVADDQIIVKNELELQNMKSRGYFEHPTEAIEAIEKAEVEVADVTAARHYQDRKLSAKAQAEARTADQATEHMVPEVPRKPGRPRKPKAVPATE